MSTPAKTPATGKVAATPDAEAPDERLFIICGCLHTAARHSDSGCKAFNPATVDKTSYTTKTWEGGPCNCPTPREVVYLSGRRPDLNPAS